MDNTLVVRDLASVDLWRQQLRKIVWSWNVPTVQFQLQEFSDEQNQGFSALAGSYQKACGCKSGSVFMSVTLVGMVLFHFLSGQPLSNITLTHVLSLVVITVLAALSGKLLGLLWARWRLLRLAASTRNTLVSGGRPAVTKSL
jgi:hypothetical protein